MQLTKGDQAILQLTATDDGVSPHDLSGATFESKITDSTGTVTTYDNTHHAVTISANGQYSLTLSTTETAALAAGIASIATRVTQSGQPVTFFGDKVLLVRTYP
jgi:hypothetical protein